MIPGFLVSLAILAVMVWMFVRIAAKAGINRLWAIVMVVPFLNIAMLYVFAFIRWPAIPEAPNGERP